MSFSEVMMAAVLISGLVSFLIARHRRSERADESHYQVRRQAIAPFWKDADIRAAACRDLVRSVQTENEESARTAMSNVDISFELLLEMHPVLQRAARDSPDIQVAVMGLSTADGFFAHAAKACLPRVGRPGLLESAAFYDLVRYNSDIQSYYLELREHLDKWSLETISSQG